MDVIVAQTVCHRIENTRKNEPLELPERGLACSNLLSANQTFLVHTAHANGISPSTFEPASDPSCHVILRPSPSPTRDATPTWCVVKPLGPEQCASIVVSSRITPLPVVHFPAS
eukprot:m.24157 g.24157  ORF g.24157 m.24157 type:complete len:114 (-) comp6034_c0_seq1:1866-2207(-)